MWMMLSGGEGATVSQGNKLIGAVVAMLGF
jgi:hypothetical protein